MLHLDLASLPDSEGRLWHSQPWLCRDLALIGERALLGVKGPHRFEIRNPKSARSPACCCCSFIAPSDRVVPIGAADFGFRISDRFGPFTPSRARSPINAKSLRSQGWECRKRPSGSGKRWPDRSRCNQVGARTVHTPMAGWPAGALAPSSPPRSGWVWLIRRRMRTAHLARPRPLGFYVEMPR